MKNLIIILIFFNSVIAFGSLQVDDAETGTLTNSLGGTWIKFNDEFSTAGFIPDQSPGYSGLYCRLFEWTFNSGSSGPYAGTLTSLNFSWTGVI